jgi:hypothetical protein
VVDDGLAAAMALLGEKGIAHPCHAIDTGAMGEFQGRVQHRFFEVTTGTDCRNERQRHREPSAYTPVVACDRNATTLVAEGTTAVVDADGVWRKNLRIVV